MKKLTFVPDSQKDGSIFQEKASNILPFEVEEGKVMFKFFNMDMCEEFLDKFKDVCYEYKIAGKFKVDDYIRE